MPNRHDVEAFVAAWLAENLPVQPEDSNLASEVDRLAADLTGAARAEGISGGDIHRVLGDIDDHLIAQCRRIRTAAATLAEPE